ncbi:hypothetical protein ACSQ67_022601 [Phaseolus vulgaris]
MAGGGGRNLEETPTWAVSTVCFVLIFISIIIEHIIHLIGQVTYILIINHTCMQAVVEEEAQKSAVRVTRKDQIRAYVIGVLVVAFNGRTRSGIKNMHIRKIASTWHPCSADDTHSEESGQGTNSRRLLAAFHGSNDVNPRRVLAGGGSDKCGEGKVPFVSSEGIHQLHIFIFVLTVFHVLYCILTMALGRAKMKRWKRWEEETKTPEYQFSHDPERFRFARETSFGRRHLSFWTKNPVLMWIVCFFRQFVRSVPKVDYLTLRHGFIMAHLAPQSHSKFDFRKYIKRSLDEDFKVVVGISPPFWLFAVLFLLLNTHGSYSYLWLPFIPLIVSTCNSYFHYFGPNHGC